MNMTWSSQLCPKLLGRGLEVMCGVSLSSLLVCLLWQNFWRQRQRHQTMYSPSPSDEFDLQCQLHCHCVFHTREHGFSKLATMCEWILLLFLSCCQRKDRRGARNEVDMEETSHPRFRPEGDEDAWMESRDREWVTESLPLCLSVSFSLSHCLSIFWGLSRFPVWVYDEQIQLIPVSFFPDSDREAWRERERVFAFISFYPRRECRADASKHILIHWIINT